MINANVWGRSAIIAERAYCGGALSAMSCVAEPEEG